MNEAMTALLVQLLITGGGIIGAWFAMRAQSRKTDADREAQLDARFTTYIEIQERERRVLKEEIDALRVEVDTLRRRLRDYEIGVDKLIRQLIRAGLTPEWNPPTNGSKPAPKDS